MYATTSRKNSVHFQIFQEWKERLNEVRAVVDQHHSSGYGDGQNDQRFRFARDAPVVAFSKGIYYEAKVVKSYRAFSFPNPTAKVSWEALSLALNGPTVPTYLVHYVGWAKKMDEDHVENKLLSRRAETVANAHGMLFAHEWNTEFRMESGMERIKVGKGAWFLEDDKYAKLDAAWQSAADMTVSFKQYSGRLRAETALAQLE